MIESSFGRSSDHRNGNCRHLWFCWNWILTVKQPVKCFRPYANIYAKKLDLTAIAPIKRKKWQKLAYRIIACNISCYHYNVVIFWLCQNDDSKFYIRKHDKRIFSTFNCCHRYTSVRTAVFDINICCSITVLSGRGGIWLTLFNNST